MAKLLPCPDCGAEYELTGSKRSSLNGPYAVGYNMVMTHKIGCFFIEDHLMRLMLAESSSAVAVSRYNW